MIYFFKGSGDLYYAVESKKLKNSDLEKIFWLLGQVDMSDSKIVNGPFIGPRREMITPWSTNAVEITQNMGIMGIQRMEIFLRSNDDKHEYDPMLQAFYEQLTPEIFNIDKKPEPTVFINDISEYNHREGLALNAEEINYLNRLSAHLGRKLTDSEIFGFSQVNSEHCRHKIFNGQFIIDGEKKKDSLFQLIKLTTKTHPNRVVSAYKDNCAFFKGPVIEQFAPVRQDQPGYFEIRDIESVISLKAETHNFPTTVEPFNGAATGTGGEIRDRMGGGKGAIPMAGTAVYMTSYPRLDADRQWEKEIPPRKWLYQTPGQILIKASNGASDFGNKFGQPLICGSLLTFEHGENNKIHGFDKVIMLAGGIGYGKKTDSEKGRPEKGDRIVLMGGDNYRIGMGGGAVSSVATGEYKNTIELNAVQRSNPEMQKRVVNAIRALAESDRNPVISIHDHGAGGHLNCLSELVENSGGKIDISKLPVGDPTLSEKEIIGNESQERMGLLLKKNDIPFLKAVAERERSPMYVIGEATGDMQFTFENSKTGSKPLDLKLSDMFGSPPRTIMKDKSVRVSYKDISYDQEKPEYFLFRVLQLEAVACKDWLTNKVDRSVTGKVARQQTTGSLQLPLNNVGVVALDYTGRKGIATSIGHAPVSALIDPVKGSVLSITEALTNIIWAPLQDGISGISLSANWMWPCRNPGEDARLYNAVKAASNYALALGINIPTGKDSLSMTQKYPDGKVVYSPGAVIISAAAEVTDIRKVVEPALIADPNTSLIYIDLSGEEPCLGGSSFAQVVNRLGTCCPGVSDAAYVVNVFNTIQSLISDNLILAGHDISAGGLITTLLEMTFPTPGSGLDIDLESINAEIIPALFSENPGIVIQVSETDKVTKLLKHNGLHYHTIGRPVYERKLKIQKGTLNYSFEIDECLKTWYKTSYLLDRKQCGNELALQRYTNFINQPVLFTFPSGFTGRTSDYGIDPKRRKPSGIRTAIIREKGVNGDREMANALYLAGMDVKDVHMTDLVSGRETLDDINMIVFVGGFSNSDVLGSAKGWAGAFLYNFKAKEALDRFYAREDTLSLGICNGCQLMMELGLVTPEHEQKPVMIVNDSKKFESIFLTVDIRQNNSVMLHSLKGTRLGIWVAHGEGKFSFPYNEDQYNIPAKYSYDGYPGNPNGSDFSTAALCSADGRHLVMMPHIERSMYPWNWGYYPSDRKKDEITPWAEAFVNARDWIREKVRK